jgi:glutathione peroxidase-family protein
MAATPTDVYGFKALDIDNNEVSMSDFKGKVIVFVNVASQ